MVKVKTVWTRSPAFSPHQRYPGIFHQQPSGLISHMIPTYPTFDCEYIDCIGGSMGLQTSATISEMPAPA